MMENTMKFLFSKSFLLLGLSFSFGMAQPTQQPCPDEVKDLPAGTTCWSGQDDRGAYYWIVKPQNWNGNLVLHAHGGPFLGNPKLQRVTEDLKRWSIWTREGYAWAASSFSQGGVAVMSAAKDTANLLPIATQTIGKPKKVILHGQSWGASVAARAAEINGPLSEVSPKVDALLLTSGVLGGARSYDFRFDLRVIWQAVCGTHPKATLIPDKGYSYEYPIWQGLPKDKKMTDEEFNQIVNACLGLDKPETERTQAQKDNGKTIARVVKIPETSIKSHLKWATYHFQDIVWNRLDGKNPFANETVRYGSKEDEKLNSQVARYKADPKAVAALTKDINPTGNIALPILTMRGIGDPTAFVELAAEWETTVTKAGHANNMVQLYTNDKEHSYLSDAQYIAAMNALLAWVDRGEKPTPASVEQRCKELDATKNECRIVPEYKPAPLSSRSVVR